MNVAAGHLGTVTGGSWRLRKDGGVYGCVRFGAVIKVAKLIVVSHLRAQRKSRGLWEPPPFFFSEKFLPDIKRPEGHAGVAQEENSSKTDVDVK